ncbi:MAG: ASKHA domain-containing protein [Desulfohalobiaceae bacterium]
MQEQDNWVRDVEMAEPSFGDNVADADRLRRSLASGTDVDSLYMDLELIRNLPELFREHGYRASCCLFRDGQGWLVTGVTRPDREEPWLGLAVDLGTTKYVLALIELASGRELARVTRDNPQVEVGTDILTRIHSIGDSTERLQSMQGMLLEDMRGACRELCREAGEAPEHIVNMALAGNTAMTHFFLALPPKWIIREPYIPALNSPDLIPASRLDLPLGPQARVMCFPGVGSYFGGDLLAGILSSGMQESEEISILVDVGTNAEVVLGCRDWLIACAGAAGPALEEGMSEIGKQAGPGIIDKVWFDADAGDFRVRTLDGEAPVGICGSGIIDLAAELFRCGLLDFRGKFVPDAMPERFRTMEGITHFILIPGEESGTGEDLLLGQPEIDSLIRSKAAMYTILETITFSVGLGLEDISRFYVAGTFGSYIDPDSAVRIGMLPDLPRESFTPLGNSSLAGAILVLQDPRAVPEVHEIATKVTYLELNVNQEFMNRFSAAKFLPHTDRSRFPSLAE